MTDDAVEEGDSVGWTQEHEAVSGQIENEPGEEETTQEYGIPEEEAWNTVVAADDQMEEDKATQKEEDNATSMFSFFINASRN